MSGGAGAKKKPPKTHGWEEAGSEFYQESYPGDGDPDLFQKDPQHLATLLPSKQRAAATVLRMRTGDRTMRRQATLRSTITHRRMSTTQDVQVSMLPDLSENISNEQTVWEEIMLIKTMPIPMAEKKELKYKILNQPNLRLQGYEQFKWKRRKLWQKLQTRVSEYCEKLELWKDDLKKIEGRFGTGVVSYFLFIKWLLFINLFTFAVVFSFIVLPLILWKNQDDNDVSNINSTENSTCSNVGSMTDGDEGSIMDMIGGAGIFACTYLFYGYYPSEILGYSFFGVEISYNFPLFYVMVIIGCLGVALVATVRTGANGFKERLIEREEGQLCKYCDMIFGAWDFCIQDTKAGIAKRGAIYREILDNLKTEKRQNSPRDDKSRASKLFAVRLAVNLTVLGILGACACIVYYVFDYSATRLNEATTSESRLLYEFLPSLTIVFMNVTVPFLFCYLSAFERYRSPFFVVRLTLIRTVLLRMASLLVLYATLYNNIRCVNDASSSCRFTVECWETYVGQQIYKLYVSDFAIGLFVTFFVNLPRSLLARNFRNRFCVFVGEQSFDLPKHALDIVYAQTLCWVGGFYAPLLSGLAVINLFVVFYVKKFACLVNSRPGDKVVYRASRSDSMFMMVVLVALAFAILPLAYTISELRPSPACGPYRNVSYVWNTVEQFFFKTPDWFRAVAGFTCTAGFAVPLLVCLCLAFYYYSAVNSANRQMVKVLKNQLVLEGHDKQFLLERLSMFIKQQQQENQKRTRRAEEADRNRNT